MITEARRLDGGDLQAATSLLTTSVARASPSTSSEMMSRGFEVCTLDRLFVGQVVDVLEVMQTAISRVGLAGLPTGR